MSTQMRSDIFSNNRNGAPSDDWRLVRFRKEARFGAAFDGEEAIFKLLDYLRCEDAITDAPSIMFVAAPRSASGERLTKRYDAYRRAQSQKGAGSTKDLLIISAPAPLNQRAFVTHLSTRLLSQSPGPRDDAAAHICALLRRNNVSMLFVDGMDSLMQCRHQERTDLLELFSRVTIEGEMPVVGVCSPLNNSYLAAAVPFTEIQACLNQARKKSVFECLAAVTGGARA